MKTQIRPGARESVSLLSIWAYFLGGAYPDEGLTLLFGDGESAGEELFPKGLRFSLGLGE